ncbi:flagellar motor protein MotB [candidate division KSB1 bacterium]|nr:flagellar motor protein MotB [candidate division KSB1 bacterium]
MSARKAEECPPKGAPAYMTTYGDLMTLLLTFFVLLLSFSSMREAKFRRAIGSLKGALGVLPNEQSTVEPQIIPIPQMTNLQESEISESIVEMQEASAEMDISEAINLEIVEEGILITISDTVTFLSGSEQLQDRILPFLTSVADMTKGWPNEIIVYGHTDTDAVSTSNLLFRDNRELSFFRANEVVRYLALQGVPLDTMTPVPMGEYHPVDTNDTERGKARNRRVELLIKYDRDSGIPGNVKAYLDRLNINY